MEIIKINWRVALENKIFHEIGTRLFLWQNYLNDYFNDPYEFSDAYVGEVRWRVMLQLLSNEVSGNFKERYLLDTSDEKIRIKIIPGEFIWSDYLTSNLPASEFWFLYGYLPSR
jgi:hypothetical protein